MYYFKSLPIDLKVLYNPMDHKTVVEWSIWQYNIYGWFELEGKENDDSLYLYDTLINAVKRKYNEIYINEFSNLSDETKRSRWLI